MHKFFQNVWSVFMCKIVRNMSEYVTLCPLILRNKNWQDNCPLPCENQVISKRKGGKGYPMHGNIPKLS